MFSYSLALKGEYGTGVVSIIEEYARNKDKTTAPTSGWSTNPPVLEEGYYKLHLQAYTSDGALTTSKDLYFNLLEAEQGDLEDYDSGYQLGIEE